MSSDWEYSEKNCPKCHSQMAWRRCYGCEDGYVEDDDGINGRSLERCDTCNGRGYERWCRECGWDDVYKEFLSPQYEAEWQAKQAAASPDAHDNVPAGFRAEAEANGERV